MLSICLVAYNEEKMIRRCLESVKNIADEIIIVMDGKSQDKTEAICREYTDKVFIRNHIGFSDPHLPFAFKQAKGDWVLRIDADEFFTEESAKEIKPLMLNDSIDGYFFLWRLWNGKKYITKNKPHKPVLFRKNKLFFLGVPHGIMETYGKSQTTNISLEHQPEYNNWNWSTSKTKHLRRIKLHAQFLFKEFSEVPKYNYRGRDYPRSIKIRKRFFFLFPFFAAYRFLCDISNGERNMEAVKVSFSRAFYEFLLGYFIFYEKIKSNTTGVKKDNLHGQ